MKYLKFLLLSFVIIFAVSCSNMNLKDVVIDKLVSPEGKIVLTLEQKKPADSSDYYLYYKTAMIKGNDTLSVLGSSPLGLTRKDEDFTKNLLFKGKGEKTEIKERYEMLSGKKRINLDHCYEQAFYFVNGKGSRLNIVFRVYDEGMAFRYVFPEKSNDQSYTVVKEQTGFNLPQNGKAWMHPYDDPSKWTPAYETYFENNIKIGTPSPKESGWAFPALFKVNGTWMLISEAGLDPAYCATHLEKEAPDGLYSIRFPEKEEGLGEGDIHPSSSLPWNMPWRFAIIGESPETIVESNLVYHLSQPTTLQDTDWIIPGKASWSWWSDHASSTNYENLKTYVDLAAEMGWKYSLVDANWNNMEGGNIKQLIEYANAKNVSLLMWYNSGGPHNSVEEEPRDMMNNSERRQQEFKKLQKWGVKGIKVDFFQSDKQDMIQLYYDILKDAAKYNILVNFHGCTLPRGWTRTFPHLLTLEAVKGAEVYSFGEDYPEKATWHNTILPFTRNVIGPMDYTPVTFSDQKYPHITTNGHELALSVVFESGIIHMAGSAESYLETPDFVKKYLADVPAAWDDTKLIDGIPGSYAFMARRKGKNWYFAGINGENIERKVSARFPFILFGKYAIIMINDGDKDRSFSFKTDEYKFNEEISFTMKPYGGFVGKLIYLGQ